MAEGRDVPGIEPATQGKARRVALVLAAIGTFAGLYVASRYNYLLFHTVAELFSIIIGGSIFAIAWNSRAFLKNGYVLVLGMAFGFVGILDLVHALTYRGMAMFPDQGANIPTQLWIAGRYVQALSLSAGPLLLGRTLRPSRVLAAYAVASVLILISIFTGVFPDCYVEGAGLTPFKIVSEYLICVVLVAVIAWLVKNRQAFHHNVLPWLVWSIVFTIAAELAFTLYVDVYGIANLLGHYLKIVAFACVYQAIIKTGLTQPYALLLREVKQSEERLRVIGDNLPESVVYQRTRDKEGRYVFLHVSAGIERLNGVTVEQALRDADVLHRQIVPPYFESLKAAEDRSARDMTDIDMDIPIRRPDGNVRWMRFHSRPRQLPDGSIVWDGVQTDITERREFQSELERLVRERTAKLQEMVGELQHVSYAMVHDMRAPLRALSGYAMLLADCSEAERGVFTQRIAAAARRMDLQIRDALSYTQAVLQDVALQPVALGPVLRDIIAMYPNLGADKAEIVIAADLPVVWGNEALLTQCFSNLLGNAVKFVKAGVRPRIRVWAEPGGMAASGQTASPGAPEVDGREPAVGLRRVRVWVEDNGVGIPQSAISRIFGMFERGSDRERGNGIGLAIVRKVVERMGGAVGVESEVDTGSRFWVELRVCDADVAKGGSASDLRFEI